MIETIELWVSEHSVAIFHRSKLVARVAVGTDGVPILNVLPADDEAVRYVASMPLGEEVRRLDVMTSVLEQLPEESVALPRRQRYKTRTETITAPRATKARRRSLQNVDTIAAEESSAILTKILDSLLENPTPTKAETAAVSKAIAAEVGVGLYQVAGVRANLTRGTYGRVSTLLRKRRDQRG